MFHNPPIKIAVNGISIFSNKIKFVNYVFYIFRLSKSQAVDTALPSDLHKGQ